MDVMREKRRVAKLLRSVAVSCSQSTVCDGCVDPLHHPPPPPAVVSRVWAQLTSTKKVQLAGWSE